MRGASRTFIAAYCAILVSACGGGKYSGAPSSANYDLQTGIANMVTNGLSANVALSGTASVSGVSHTFTGSGTFTRAPGVSATFNATLASSQATTVTGTITVAGQSSPYSTSVTDYYASSDAALLGEVSGSEYDVAQAPIVFPAMIVGGSSGTLGTFTRYTDSTMSVSLGTAQGADALRVAGAEVHRGSLTDLDSLRSGAAQSDAVIHTAFNHDFSKFAENCAEDRRAIEAIGVSTLLPIRANRRRRRPRW